MDWPLRSKLPLSKETREEIVYTRKETDERESKTIHENEYALAKTPFKKQKHFSNF
jgi:hypothetical protein